MPCMQGRDKLSAGASLAFALVLLAPEPALAFGATGHLIVGHVAETRICAAARTEIRALTGRLSLPEDGLWADRIRSDPSWDRARPWHYINVPDGGDVDSAPRARGGDILAALERFTAELRDASLPKQRRLEAYYFVVHLVADLHQPLHVGRAEDLGGNLVDVAIDGEYTNLHVYWDTEVLEGQVRDTRAYADQLGAAYTAEEQAAWQAGGPLDWAAESLALRPAVYDFVAPQNGRAAELDRYYRTRALGIVRQRLAQAGVRLAGLLNGLFCGPGDVPDPAP